MPKTKVNKVQLLTKKFERVYLVKNANKVKPGIHYVLLEGTPLQYDPEDVASYISDAKFALGKKVGYGKLLTPDGETYSLDEPLIAILMKEGTATQKKEVAAK